MPPRGVEKDSKLERQYEHIKDRCDVLDVLGDAGGGLELRQADHDALTTG